MQTAIRPLQGREEIDFCARLMAGHSEVLLGKTIAPWREFKKRPV